MNNTPTKIGNPDLSIVVPMYNEEGNVDVFNRELAQVLDDLNIACEIIYIDDGSTDNTWMMIQHQSRHDSRVKGLSFSRNFGHQYALFAGLHFASGKAIVTMDGDLQHPPGLIPQLVDAWREGYKVVNTTRIDHQNISIFKKTTSRWFYRIFSRLSGLQLTEGTSDFRLIDKQVAQTIIHMRDAELFLRGIVHWTGFSAKTIPFQAADRYSGTTKFNILKMVKFSVAAIVSFSIIPLKLGIWLGFATSVLAFAELVYIIVRYVQGLVVPGWASTLTIISFMFGVLFILIGILGAYLANIFETIKNRPRFLINETSGFSDDT